MSKKMNAEVKRLFTAYKNSINYNNNIFYFVSLSKCTISPGKRKYVQETIYWKHIWFYQKIQLLYLSPKYIFT